MGCTPQHEVAFMDVSICIIPSHPVRAFEMKPTLCLAIENMEKIVENLFQL